MPTYEEAAQIIIKEAIKSAVFIDENAKEPFMSGDFDESVRSEELYKDFKEKSISLDIYKYNDATYQNQKEYLFSNRDLVLLDWKLDGDTGEDKSLSILSEIVKMQPHIHFCVIYTSEKPEVVFDNILSYFSGVTEEECEELKIEYADLEDVIKKNLHRLCELRRWHLIKARRKELLTQLKTDPFNKELIDKVNGKGSHPYYEFVKLGIAFSDELKSKLKESSPSDIDADALTVCIDNTIITVFNKNKIQPDQIYKNFSQQLASYDRGVMHLVGLEMRNLQRKGCSFIDSGVLSVTKETLGYHKKQNPDAFAKFIQDVMAEHLKTKIGEGDLSIISAIPTCDYKDDSDMKGEYAAMNVFYNSQRIKDGSKQLSFGDVFKYGDKYYICITALCDCAHPENRDHYYYFAEGKEIGLEKALAKKEAGYISYLSPNCCVMWDKKDNNGDYSHVVPVSYLVPDNNIVANKLTIKRFKDNIVDKCEFEYITTIRQNYTQRIANYAFSHPVRVGIDFVNIP